MVVIVNHTEGLSSTKRAFYEKNLVYEIKVYALMVERFSEALTVIFWLVVVLEEFELIAKFHV